MKILVLNSGSSSLKYQLFDVEGGQYKVVAKGLAERIGIDGSQVSIKIGEQKTVKQINLPTHSEAISAVIDLLLNGAIKSVEEITAVGHRAVHGGEEFSSSVLITDEVMEKFEKLSPLAPLHNPANLIGMRAVKSLLPNVPQVAVFDTAFHQTMPKEAFLYGIPLEQYTKHQIRRYGFHGTSHLYVSRQVAKIFGKEDIKVVTCHLGNGASLAAVKNGRCIDTSMGFTPLAGVVMGTRSGDIDPYIPLHIMKSQNLTVDEANNLLNKQSGMLGLTGFSDMRDVEDKYLEGEPKAVTAMQVYVYNILRFIGSYIAAMGGVDAIVFTAGIGENSPIIRKMIIERLGYLGMELDEENNNKRGSIQEITKSGSKVRAFVIPTDEELVIAQDTVNLI